MQFRIFLAIPVLFICRGQAAPVSSGRLSGRGVYVASTALASAPSLNNSLVSTINSTPPSPSNAAAVSIVTTHTQSITTFHLSPTKSNSPAPLASPSSDGITDESSMTQSQRQYRLAIPIPVIVILCAFAPCAFFVLLHFGTVLYKRQKAVRTRAGSSPSWSVVHLLGGSRSNMGRPDSSCVSPNSSLDTKDVNLNKGDSDTNDTGTSIGYGRKGRYNWMDSPSPELDIGNRNRHTHAYAESRASSYLYNPRLQPLPEYASFSQPSPKPSSFSQPSPKPSSVSQPSFFSFRSHPPTSYSQQPSIISHLQQHSPPLSPPGCSRPLVSPLSCEKATFRAYNHLSHSNGQAPSRPQFDPQSQSRPCTPFPLSLNSSESFNPYLSQPSPSPSRCPNPTSTPRSNLNSLHPPLQNSSSASNSTNTTPMYVPPLGLPGTPIFGHFRNRSGRIFGLSGWILNGVKVPIGAMRARAIGGR